MEFNDSGNSLNGFFAVDKPPGFTSFDVVAKLRGILKTKKIGHGGTLDPMATGVLPIFLGKATKAADLTPDQSKTYIASARFGIKTDTGDVTGNIIESNEIIPDKKSLSLAIASFAGKTEQLPPMYSAVRIEGKRLYEFAREGMTVERKPREIEIYSIELLKYDKKEKVFGFEVHCSKGSYIRTLSEDIAKAAGALASLSALRRIKSGLIDERECLKLPDVEEMASKGDFRFIKPIEQVFSVYRGIELSIKQEKDFLNGIRISRFPGSQDGDRLRVYGKSGFLALADISDGKIISAARFV